MNGAAVSWASTLQPVVAQSTIVAEHMAAAVACKEAWCPRKLLRDMQLRTKGPTQLWGENQGAFALVKDPVLHARTNHIDVHHHAVRVACREFVFQYCPTTDMIADALTKGLARPAFENVARAWGRCLCSDACVSYVPKVSEQMVPVL
jgi:hypothetical protein